MQNFASMPSKYNSHYRSRTEIDAQILQAANDHNEITKTKIIYIAFLSYKQLQEYLPPLIQNGLLEYQEGTKSYKITKKGLKFLKINEKIEELVAEMKLPERQINK
ncbi:MAG TPA: winged helix-turn-helix domain-containing protein [Nitrososphaeraceae archaeon]|nr:winged helix-turn-helix domain-containing protein [Nitrososphaeraceae archaeon]